MTTISPNFTKPSPSTVITKRAKWFLFLSPLSVLLFTRMGIEWSIQFIRLELAWIPAFMVYYTAIMLTFLVAKKCFSIPYSPVFSVAFKPFPKFSRLGWAISIPALLPVTVLLSYYSFLPVQYFFYILLFACVNSIMEESYWRGLLYFIPVSNVIRVVYTATLFSFSHFFLWADWYKEPLVLFPTLVSTFIMGVAYMWFLDKEKRLLYPIVSHFIVDVFNLSVAVYVGLVPANH